MAYDIKNNFKYHVPNSEQQSKYEEIRVLGRNLVEFILAGCPESRERSIALTKVEEAVMWANASIARNE